MSTLEFGIFDSFGPFEMEEFPTVVEVYEAHIREAQEAEQLGYRYYFFIEHQNSPVCAVTAPNIYLTALASRTSALRFGLMIYQLPFIIPSVWPRIWRRWTSSRTGGWNSARGRGS
jgi:alkanesulfonate monooxygenase SsuD/methylene tetrahydromethanopterin reductase-like flavin-dependent oxidoreductase (luciferase family)